VGRALWPSTVGGLTTDASPWGWWGHWGNLLPAAGFFTMTQRNLHINFKEVCAVRFCLLASGKQLADRLGVLRLRVVSRVAMHVVNSFTSRSAALMTKLRKLHKVVQLFGVTLKVSWLAFVANVWTDASSRQNNSDDWRLHPKYYSRLDEMYGVHTVDRFASFLNTHCPRFTSRHHCLGTKAVDAFSVAGAASDNSWVNPPFEQASRVVDKIVADGANATVLLSLWTAQSWWSRAVEHANEAWLLPKVAGVFLSGCSRRPAPHPTWRLAVFRFVSGGVAEADVQWRRQIAVGAAAHTRRHAVRSGAVGAERRAKRWLVPPPAAALMELPLAFSAFCR